MIKTTKRLALASAVVLATTGLIQSAMATPLLSGFGGAEGYGELAMSKNDDSSSSQLNLPFTINFFGETYNTFFINNNGNITFSGAVSGYTPSPFPASSQPMIAPFWADVDTRCGACGNVYVASPNEDTVVVTWSNVGYYSSQADKLNNFQLVLRDRSGDVENSAQLPNGDFDIEFRYEQLEWTTGSASGGSGGLGGTPAQAGFDAGDGQNFFILPGSFSSAVLNLVDNTNVVGGDDGFWQFAIRDGATPGSSAANPLMPVVTEDGWSFNFNVQLNQRIFIDPEIAVGYDYVVESGPNFASVLLPSVGDDIFDLWLWDGLAYYDSNIDIFAGIEYFFASGGINRFRIMGIELAAALDPTDTSAFVTGLTFVEEGLVSMTQSPVVVNTDPSSVPEPTTFLLFGTALLGCLARRRRV